MGRGSLHERTFPLQVSREQSEFFMKGRPDLPALIAKFSETQ